MDTSSFGHAPVSSLDPGTVVAHRATATKPIQQVPAAESAGTHWPGRAVAVLALAALFGGVVLAAVAGPDLGLSTFKTYKALLFLHVTTALVTFGSTFAIPVFQPLAARNGVSGLRLALRFIETLEKRVVTPGSMVVVATGLGLLLSEQTGYRDSPPAWLVAGIVWVAAAAVLANAVQGPTLRRGLRLLDEVADGDAPPAELGALALRLKIVGQLLALSTVGILFLMIWKPGA